MKEYSLYKEITTGENVGNNTTVNNTEKANGVYGEITGSGNVGVQNNSANLPAKIGLWGKVKAFLFQEIDLNAEIVLELTPKEKKVLTEVHDFLFQEVKFPELHDFLFQEVTIFGKKNKK